MDKLAPNFEKMLQEVKKPAYFQDFKLRLALKLYKWQIIKGWNYTPLIGKVKIHWWAKG